MKRPRIVAVILAGGSGTRFWPLSRKTRPKPLLRAGGRGSLLAEAVARGSGALDVELRPSRRLVGDLREYLSAALGDPAGRD